MGTVQNLNELYLAYVTSVNAFSTISIQIQQKKATLVRCEYTCQLHYLRRQEIQTLRTLVDVSLLFFFKLTAYLLSVCIVDTNASMTFL